MRIRQIWRYPVKSMIGETVDEAELDDLGVVGDRTWATRDLERGGIRGAKKIGQLMRFAATSIDDQQVLITFPDGTSVRTSDPQVDERLSAALGHRVHLEALRPPDDTDHYRRGGPDHDDLERELRDIFGREDDEPLPDFSVFPPEVTEYESPPGTYYDCYPLLVVTTSALAALAEALPDAAVDVRRFRPSLVIDTGSEPGHPEFGWSGQRTTVGSAEIEFLAPCPRCVMVTRELDAGTPTDRTILRHIVRDLDQNLGVYARITRPGRITVGEPLATPPTG